MKGGINMYSTGEKIRWALFDYTVPSLFMFFAIVNSDYYKISFGYLIFAFLAVGFLNSQGIFLYMYIIPVCAVIMIAGHFINFDYQYYMTLAGLACFPLGSLLLKIKADKEE